MPSRDPSAAPPSRTTIGCSVNGTGVNGSGTLICAAAAVTAVTNSTAASLVGIARSSRRADVASSVLPSQWPARTVSTWAFYWMHAALTIAGSGSGGGAGIQADLKTFAAHGVHGTTAVTAITAQNTTGVIAWQAVPADLVIAQIEAVAADLGAEAVKIGMLANTAIVEA